MKILGVIPARLGSTRLAEKVLRPIQGKPMIQWVWERARAAAKLSELVVACDDKRILECVESFGGRAVLTRTDHPNGSSRVAEVARGSKAEVIVNIQGDEPMIHPAGIDLLAGLFEKDAAVRVATLAVPRKGALDYENPNVVKVVCDENKNALYFSRSPLPYYRDAAQGISFLKHLGIYAYKREFLLDFIGWKTGILEDAEKLEQLRILERGVAIRVIETPHDSWSVDTAEDVSVVERKMAESGAGLGV